MKLFYVTVLDDIEEYTEFVVAKTKEEAEEKISNMDCWSCLMYVNATEIDIVDNYKIILREN